jgi:hypothetical protein
LIDYKPIILICVEINQQAIVGSFPLFSYSNISSINYKWPQWIKKSSTSSQVNTILNPGQAKSPKFGLALQAPVQVGSSVIYSNLFIDISVLFIQLVYTDNQWNFKLFLFVQDMDFGLRLSYLIYIHWWHCLQC